MLNLEKVKAELNKRNFSYKNNIVPGHSTYKVKWILPAGPVIVIASERATSYLFGFDEKGIHVFPVEGNWNILDCCLIEWKNITKFEMKKGILLENTMNITTNEMKVSLKINKMVAGNPWVKENIKELARILKAESGNCDSIILPAITGLNREDVVDYLRKEINKPIYLLPTLPPSVPGIHTQQKLRSVFQQNGGVFMLGDNVLCADIKENRISQIYSFNHGDIPFVGQNFILATGSYFSQGLIASTEKIYEPIFDLDVTFTPNRTQWYNSDVFDTQPYQSFGIKTDSTFRCTREGKIFENLYAAGAILEGFNPLKEGCGAGVSILSAMYIAEQILSK